MREEYIVQVDQISEMKSTQYIAIMAYVYDYCTCMFRRKSSFFKDHPANIRISSVNDISTLVSFCFRLIF